MKNLITVIAMALLLAGCQRTTTITTPPQSVVSALQRGVNLAVWTGATELDAVHAAQVHPDDADLALIKRLGFQHVRISFDPSWLADEQLAPRKERLAEMQRDLARVTDHGLFVVLSLQASSAFKQRLGHDAAWLQSTAALWRTVAKTLQGFGPEQLAFELINEPELDDPAQVRKLLSTLAAGVRRSAPNHVLVAQGPRYSDVDDLIRLAPLDDRNVIYSFHFYEPKNFTHQGVPYGWPMWGLLRDLPYPSSPEAVEPALEFMTFEALEHARYYGQQQWNRSKLAEALAPAAQWASQHKVTLWCSEFGAYRYHMKPEDRARWLSDTHELLAAQRIGWTLWDYAGYFGLVSGPQGQRVVDRNAAKALGLNSVAD